MRSMIITAPALVLLTCCLSAQEFRATITGQVTDQNGAAIAGANVKAVQNGAWSAQH